jgi:AraC-like DNA-binding protein
LGVNVRTINRKLNRLGKSFEVLRDEVRCRLAVHLLGSTEFSITEISARVGYSEPSSLSHSCQRWFRLSPSSLRRGLNARSESTMETDSDLLRTMPGPGN